MLGHLVSCAGTQCRFLYIGLAKVEIAAELSLQSKLGEPPRRNLEQSLSKTTVVRVKAIVTFKASLFIKLRIIIALELGCGATAGNNPERCQETEGDLHVRVPPDSYHAGIETSAVDDELLAKSLRGMARSAAYSLTQ
ncbi:hypothetical protein Acr_16g0004220 [Actinidia rufa]|uniref:Uncharacterized protein n=1 Tax=Actinidia rufa TaxID=165716 RepID=A0A7J0G0R3_9ERIC|nr:hypothetical protein Acr_16g0004220 [Actinidia rufa]